MARHRFERDVATDSQYSFRISLCLILPQARHIRLFLQMLSISISQSKLITTSDFAWGTAEAQSVTLSFWAYPARREPLAARLPTTLGPDLIRSTYSIPVASTWTRIIVTIPGDTLGTNGQTAMWWAILFFDLGCGTSFAGGRGMDGGKLRRCHGRSQCSHTNGAAFNVTGVKLEIGSVATPYNRQSLAKSMADCQRYY